MSSTPDTPPVAVTAGRRALYPLYAAGFVTAFGAHSIAAGLGLSAAEQHGAWTDPVGDGPENGFEDDLRAVVHREHDA